MGCKMNNSIKWIQLTLGHLSRNKFWGEDPDTQYHSVVASSTLVKDGDINILVDPTLPVEDMEKRLKLYCGLDRNDIDIVFATHFHTDHRIDAEKYPNAKLYMSEESVKEVEELRVSGGPMAEIFLNGAVFDFEAAPRHMTANVEVVPLPGHTLGLSGLYFTSDGKKILLSGDKIMNPEYYAAREGYFIDASQEKTRASMDWALANADIIVPGHGDFFYTDDPAEKKILWRKLNLCADGEESSVLVKIGKENIIINPVLHGHILREAIYDAWGLDPSDITRVICLKDDPKHTMDLKLMSNAKYYIATSTESSMGFESWISSDEFPIDIMDISGDPVCVFESGGRKIAVTSLDKDDKRISLDADIVAAGNGVKILK